MKKIWYTIIVIATILVNSTLLNQVSRAETCVGGGSLSIISAPTAVDFAGIQASTMEQTNTVTFGNSLIFADMRNTENNITVTVSATNWTNTENYSASFEVTNLKIASDENDIIEEIICDPSTGISVSQTELNAFTDMNLDGISDPQNLITSDSRTRIGEYSITPQMELTVPAGTPAHNYRSTLTFTIY
jgi:hypothetical protein